MQDAKMSGREETAPETRPGGSLPSRDDVAEQQKRTKTIYIVYVIAALDITWMFLQFSVTPVSISETEVEISVPPLNVE